MLFQPWYLHGNYNVSHTISGHTGEAWGVECKFCLRALWNMKLSCPLEVFIDKVCCNSKVDPLNYSLHEMPLSSTAHSLAAFVPKRRECTLPLAMASHY